MRSGHAAVVETLIESGANAGAAIIVSGVEAILIIMHKLTIMMIIPICMF